MKIGLGLFRNQLTTENYRFARQAGCTHIIAHLADRSNVGGPRALAGAGGGSIGSNGSGGSDCSSSESTTGQAVPIPPEEIAAARDPVWSADSLIALRKAIQAEGLELHAIENFSPADWSDVLLDGPRRAEQMEFLKQIIRNMGQAGIPVLGYNFSIAGVWGQVSERSARGGARTLCFKGGSDPRETPIPRGEVWNMVVDPNGPPGVIDPISETQLWERLARFLREMIPAAEAAGVTLAAHPDDPPMPTLRGTPRLVYRPELYQRLLDIVPSPANALEFCMGTIQEMAAGDVYEAIDRYSAQNRIAYLHFRNVRGKVPFYTETFIDEGDIDVFRALRILKKNRYDGVLIPDHTPLMDCDAPWHAGMAYALGFMRAAVQMIEGEP